MRVLTLRRAARADCRLTDAATMSPCAHRAPYTRLRVVRIERGVRADAGSASRPVTNLCSTLAIRDALFGGFRLDVFEIAGRDANIDAFVLGERR